MFRSMFQYWTRILVLWRNSIPCNCAASSSLSPNLSSSDRVLLSCISHGKLVSFQSIFIMTTALLMRWNLAAFLQTSMHPLYWSESNLLMHFEEELQFFWCNTVLHCVKKDCFKYQKVLSQSFMTTNLLQISAQHAAISLMEDELSLSFSMALTITWSIPKHESSCVLSDKQGMTPDTFNSDNWCWEGYTVSGLTPSDCQYVPHSFMKMQNDQFCEQ